ncbi:MAG: HlyC/CorC family transporter [Rhodobacteraceae bacterium]|nr:HlyC/CorC family transporter [Paracoccaceae bacterium]
MPPEINEINAGYPPEIWWIGGAILLLLVISAFFSGSETALTAANRAKLHRMAEKGDAGAKRALTLTEDSEKLIGAVLLGNNLVNILSAALATSLFTLLIGANGIAVATLVMTLLVLIFAEVLPKTYAITNPETAAARVSRVLVPIVFLLSPIVGVIRFIVRGILRLVGVKTDPEASVMAAHQEIADAISLHHSEGMVGKDDRDRLLGALDLKEREVVEIMLHRSDIEMIDADTPSDKILAQCLQSSHTRIPLYRDEPENIIGVIHAKDLLREVHQRFTSKGLETFTDFDIMTIAMPPYFVPETTSLDDQMHEFLRRKVHFGLVVDEYGSLQGLITLEDILEEIVGEIIDEHDDDENDLTRETDGSVVVDGSMTIRDFNRACGWSLNDEDANTVAGLVIHQAQMIPVEGQVFSFQGVRFEVQTREINRLTKLKLRKI